MNYPDKIKQKAYEIKTSEEVLGVLLRALEAPANVISAEFHQDINECLEEGEELLSLLKKELEDLKASAHPTGSINKGW